jgi:hypothetical protein
MVRFADKDGKTEEGTKKKRLHHQIEPTVEEVQLSLENATCW